ncbi:hypothetical protein BKA70DRAFT_1239589 [Coprinopsis sp. MPI-PUGE-AT-0042]|nr:hypothetical protein BKA70DRAFT_1239589 [Coprinopsis sp. MPI-PUGE-AT-0042]
MPKDTTPTSPNRLLRSHNRRSPDGCSTTKALPAMYRVLKEEGAVEDHIVGKDPIPLDSIGETSDRGEPELASETTGSTSQAARKKVGSNNYGGPVTGEEQVLAALERLEKQALTRKKAADQMKTKLEEAKQQIAELQQELDEKDEALKSSQENEVQYRNWWLNEVQFMKLMLNKVQTSTVKRDLRVTLIPFPNVLLPIWCLLNHPFSLALALANSSSFDRISSFTYRGTRPLYLQLQVLMLPYRSIVSGEACRIFGIDEDKRSTTGIINRRVSDRKAHVERRNKIMARVCALRHGIKPQRRCEALGGLRWCRTFVTHLPFLANMVEHVARTSQLLVRSDDDIALRDRIDWVLEVERLLETEDILPTAYETISVLRNVVTWSNLTGPGCVEGWLIGIEDYCE